MSSAVRRPGRRSAGSARLKASILTIILSIVLAPAVHGQLQYDRVLLPIATGEIPGALGSIWISDAVVHNSDSVVRDFDADEGCFTECPPRALQPGETRHVLHRSEPADHPGLMMFVEHPSDLVAFESRIQDISRQAQTWGTEIPVVRESAFLTRPIELLNIPMDGHFRLMLRVYDIDGRTDGQVRVSLYPFPGRGQSIGDVDLSMQAPSGTHPQYKPAYAQLFDIGLRSLVPAGFNPGSVVGVRITPLTPGLRIWAFVSVTNNETQHVTTVTPQ